MKAVIRIQTPQSTNEHELSVNKSAVVGRSSKSDCKVSDETISSSHCRFFLKPDRLEIFDLNSKNGTYLNGIRIERSEIFVGDKIRIGDTQIYLAQDKMDKATIETLTFPGPSKDRIKHELRIDFTGARIQNQLNDKKSLPHSRSHFDEIQLRKKASCTIQLSKEEIRSRHKMKSNIASIIDTLLIVSMFILPLIVINQIIKFHGIHLPGLDLSEIIVKENKSSFVLGLEILSVGFFLLLNFRIFKFSLGEKFTGIEQVYRNQN